LPQKKKPRKRSLESHEVCKAYEVPKKQSNTNITECLMIAEKSDSSNPTLIKNNNITHIINMNPKKIDNYFDREQFEKHTSVYSKAEREEMLSTDLLGKIRYFNVMNWTEHTISLSISLSDDLFRFIEEAVQSYSSCLIVSVTNTCASVVVACVYLLMKFKWSIQNSIQYIHSRKPNIVITKSVL
jgi:hypothetical protein